MIETARLTLRPFRLEDVPALQANADGMGLMGSLVQLPGPKGLGLAHELVARFMVRPETSPCFAICAKDGRFIGAAGYGLVPGKPLPQLGYWLGPSHWGKGLGGEAAEAITHHAFGQNTCAALEAECRIGNETSRRILTRLGFTPTGKHFSAAERAGEAVEMECFHLTRAVWLARATQPGQIHP